MRCVSYHSRWLVQEKRARKVFKQLHLRPNVQTTTDLKPRVSEEKLTATEIVNALFIPRYGAAYTEAGELLPETLLHRGYQKNLMTAPVRITPAEFRTDSELAEACFGGMIVNHFGHFITESIARLWPVVEKQLHELPLLFYYYNRSLGDRTQFNRAIRTILQSTDLENKLWVPERAVRIQKLHIPQASWMDTHSANILQRQTGLYIGQAVMGQDDVPSAFADKDVYLSKSQLPIDYGKVIFEEELEEQLVKEGFEIVHPQQLDFADQCRLFRDSRLVAGPSGSGFHSMLFVPMQSTHLVYLRRYALNINYANIDRLCGVEGQYVHALYQHPHSLKPIFMLDVETAREHILRARDAAQ